MSITNKTIVKEGKIIDNYLVNFPQYLDKKNNSIYKLVISNSNSLTFKINATSRTIMIPFTNNKNKNPDLYQYFIDWGDGNYEQFFENQKCQHTYPISNKEYKIIIKGYYPNLSSYTTYESNDFRNYLTDIEKLGELTDLDNTFYNCSKLSGLPRQAMPDIISSCNYTFTSCKNITYIPDQFMLPRFCKSCSHIFSGCTNLSSIQNQDFYLPQTIINCDYIFANTKLNKIPDNLFNTLYDKITRLNGIFFSCKSLEDASNFNLNNFTKLSSATYLFGYCNNLKYIANDFTIPNTCKDISHLFIECFSLTNCGNITLFEDIQNCYRSFSGCKNLSANINHIITGQFTKNVNFTYTFYNCSSLIGEAPAYYLWLSDNVFTQQFGCFNGCTSLDHYDSIPRDWKINSEEIDIHQGYFGINISQSELTANNCNCQCHNNDSEVKGILFVLPIYKWLNSEKTQIAQYNFKINYGDDEEWYQVNIPSTFNDFWIDNQFSAYEGYPNSILAMLKNADQDNIRKSENYYQNIKQVSMYPLNEQIQRLEQVLYNYPYSYIHENITHVYKQPGDYIITISGSCPRLFVHQSDIWTNRFLTKIYSFKNIGLSSLNHAFCNAYRLNKLPNHPISTDITDISYAFYVKDGYGNSINTIPNQFIYPSSYTDASYAFYNCFNYSKIPITDDFLKINSNNNAKQQYMFFNCKGLSGLAPTTVSFNTSNPEEYHIGCFSYCNNLIETNSRIIPKKWKQNL